MFRLCEDNGVKQRHMRAGKANMDSIHYFHSYAVSDRIDFSHLSEEVIPTRQKDPQQIALSLLPSAEDDAEICDNISVMISLVLYNGLAFFKHSFDGVVNWHIQHGYFEQMSRKSMWYVN